MTADPRPPYRAGLPPMPDRIRHLPVSELGYPVPYFVAYVDGQPDFRVSDARKSVVCVNQQRCWVCGEPLGRYLAFAIGPMCAVNRVSSEPPSHRECAEWSAQACPFLTRPKAQRRDANLPDDARNPGGIMVERNPGVVLVWITKGYTVTRAHGGVLFRIGEPVDTVWYAQGRAATRAEVTDAFATGLPALRQIAAEDGPDALRLLDTLTKVALTCLPME